MKINKKLMVDLALLIVASMLIVIFNIFAPSILSAWYSKFLVAALMLVLILNVIIEALWQPTKDLDD
ncbi:hypothetical protein [Photobacterium sp. GB-72]|uniref:hypothetical protein n=1 Tax=Photobacterium sp. GB-72 TaxID=2022105 RepID=UPI000D165F2D|nr:hypothetical protein [Photobacterium sp. GB-72]PSV27625.1 hypothetical protein C9J40_20025 [Photobacterium sp. GB-72]